MKPKIYVFAAGRQGKDYRMAAVAEDGDELGGHISSSIGYGKWDMGLNGGTRKHEGYKEKYPEGYELVWVEDWKSHPVLSRFSSENKVAE